MTVAAPRDPTVLAMWSAAIRSSGFKERRVVVAFWVTRYRPQRGHSTTRPGYVGGLASFASLRQMGQSMTRVA